MDVRTLTTTSRGTRPHHHHHHPHHQYQHTLDALVEEQPPIQRHPQAYPQPHPQPHSHQPHSHQHPPRRASFSHAQRTPQHHQVHRRGSFGASPQTPTTTATTPASMRARLLSQRRSSRSTAASHHLRVHVRDITAILSVAIKVDGFEFHAPTMEHPEFRISTQVVFQCRQHGSKRLESKWRVRRTFQAFEGLDRQLRDKFPFDMCEIATPRLHRRRTFFRMHRSKSFLTKRCAELNAYLTELMAASNMRLTRFLDAHSSLLLRYFCNFDVGFGENTRVSATQYDPCVLCLDHSGNGRPQQSNDGESYEESQELDMAALRPLLTGGDSMQDDDTQELLDRQQLQRHQQQQQLPQQQQQLPLRARQRSHAIGSRSLRSETPSKADSKADELEANLLDDRGRNMAMCQRFECACQNMSFRLTEGTMTRILRLRGFRQTFRPVDVEGPSALYCVLFRLQQHNDLDRKLFEILSEYSSTCGGRTESSFTDSDGDNDGDAHGDDGHDGSQQLTAGVELLREALANYALLYVQSLEPHFRMSVVDLTKKIHELKSRRQQRIGALELVLLCSMLDLSIVLITNDHEGTIQEIFPLPGLKPIRRGGRLLITMGYILPTMVCVNGLYLLVDSLQPSGSGSTSTTTTRFDPTMWQGLEEMDRCLVSLIDSHVLHSELRRVESFAYDHELAEMLNKALLQAVWDDVGHNPTRFQDFQRQARQFGRSRITAGQFFTYLDIAFGADGAVYLVDFLLLMLPEVNLRKQLLRARWRSVQQHLTRRVAAVAS